MILHSFFCPSTVRAVISIPYQFSQITFGNTVLITAQCPIALCCCHWANLLVSFLNRTPPSPCLSSNRCMSTSSFGTKKVSRAPLPNRSLSVGSLNVSFSSGLLVQKITMFVKSRFSVWRVSAEGTSDSRKMRQVGKTALMVLMMIRAGGSRKSPA